MLKKSEVEAQRLKFQSELGEFGGKWFGVVELSKRTGIPRGSIHRYLRQKIDKQEVEQSPHPPHKYRVLERRQVVTQDQVR